VGLEGSSAANKDPVERFSALKLAVWERCTFGFQANYELNRQELQLHLPNCQMTMGALAVPTLCNCIGLGSSSSSHRQHLGRLHNKCCRTKAKAVLCGSNLHVVRWLHR
jgi:hypothetical protein